MTKATVIKMIPSARPKANSPLLVSSAMAVVIVRVKSADVSAEHHGHADFRNYAAEAGDDGGHDAEADFAGELQHAPCTWLAPKVSAVGMMRTSAPFTALSV